MAQINLKPSSPTGAPDLMAEFDSQIMSQNTTYERVPSFYLTNFPGLFDKDKQSNSRTQVEQNNGTLPDVRQGSREFNTGSRQNQKNSSNPPKTATGLVQRRKPNTYRSAIRDGPGSTKPSFDAQFGFGPLSTTNNTKAFLNTIQAAGGRDAFGQTFNNEAPSLTNIEIASYLKRGVVSDGTPALHRNIKNLKDFKVKQLQGAKSQIEDVHSELRKIKGMKEEILNLIQLEQHVPQSFRKDFLTHPTQAELLPKLSALNQAFVPMLEYLTAYKGEVGLSLQRMVESYNFLLLMQFEGFQTSENAKTREYNEKVKRLDILTAQVSAQKQEQDTKEDMINTLLASKNLAIKEQKERIEVLERQMEDVHEYVQKSKLDPDDPLSQEQQANARQAIMDKIQMDDVTSENISSNSSENEMMRINIEAYQDQMNQYQDAEVVRTNNLNNIQRIVGRLLRKGNRAFGTQTDPVEGLDNISQQNQDQSFRGNNNQSVMISESNKTPVKDKQQRSFTEAIDNMNGYYAKTQNILDAGANEAKLQDLSSRLNLLLDKHKSKSKSKETPGASAGMGQEKPIWTTPALILLFLENTIRKYTPQAINDSGQVEQIKPEEELKIKPIKWGDFKESIYDIYNDRVKYAAEISGSVNNSYMGMDESLVCYFIDKFHTKRRNEVEIILVEFLSNLKFYAEQQNWLRARMFCQFAGFYNEYHRGQTKQNNQGNILHRQNELDIPTNDIYSQDFFLYCYSKIITNNSNKLVNSKEGFTYLHLQNEDRMSQTLLMTFLDLKGIEYQKFRDKVKKTSMKHKENELDDKETSYIDIDDLLKLYLDEFRSVKKKYSQMLLNNFRTECRDNDEIDYKPEEMQNCLNFKNICSIINTFKEKRTFKATGMLKDANQATYLRALLYAFMCGSNGNEITEHEFIAGCNRFGIENPMPVVTQRLHFYGNNDTVEKYLETAYKKHNEAQFFNPEQYVGVIEPADLGKEAKKAVDMKETKVRKRELKKKAGAHDIRMLDKLENAHKFTSPPTAILSRGISIKIKDMMKEGPLKPNRTKMDKMTNIEWGISGDKQILVPSFGTTGALFARHFDILNSLRRRIILVKQAHYEQVNKELSAEQIEAIIKVLDKACSFLSFDDIMKDVKKENEKQYYEDITLEDDEAEAKRKKDIARANLLEDDDFEPDQNSQAEEAEEEKEQEVEEAKEN